MAVLEWPAEQAPGFRRDLEAIDSGSYLEAAKVGYKAMLVALEGLGVPWGAPDVVVRTVQRRVGAPVLRRLVQRGVPVGSRKDIDQAVAESRRGRGSMSYKEGEWVRRLAV